MKVRFLAIGKTNEEGLLPLIELYKERINKYTTFNYEEIQSKGRKQDASIHQLRDRESVMPFISPSDHLILLDQEGESFTSESFATYLNKKIITLQSPLVFLSGGPYGFDKQLKERAQATISLSQMTFPHQLVRLIFLEQLYRAFSIINKEGYHH